MYIFLGFGRIGDIFDPKRRPLPLISRWAGRMHIVYKGNPSEGKELERREWDSKPYPSNVGSYAFLHL